MAKFTWIAVAVVSAGLAACGGDDENNSQLSYADFGREANEICQRANDEIKPISERLTGEAQNDAPIIGELLEKQEAAIADFKELKPPDELQADFDRFVSISDQQVAAARDAESAAKSGDTQAYRAELQKLEPLDKESDAAASRLGAAGCAEN